MAGLGLAGLGLAGPGLTGPGLAGLGLRPSVVRSSASGSPGGATVHAVVIEFLTFTVDPADHEGWLDADARHWTAFLSQQAGFVSKQVWIDREQADRIHAVITWTDEASWKAIPADDLARVDDDMGEWVRPLTCRTLDVARTT